MTQDEFDTVRASMSEADLRDGYRSMFEDAVRAHDMPLDLTHGTCNCGAISCAYADEATTVTFYGFMLALDLMASVGVNVFAIRKPGSDTVQ